MTEPKPVPEPMPERDLLRQQVAELAQATRPWDGYCGHAHHPTMNQLAEKITEKLNWRAETIKHRQTIARIRDLHAPTEVHGRVYCAACSEDACALTCTTPWPCPTIRALDGEP